MCFSPKHCRLQSYTESCNNSGSLVDRRIAWYESCMSQVGGTSLGTCAQTVLVCIASQIILTSRHKPPGSSPRHHSHLLLPGTVYPLLKVLLSPFPQSATCLGVCILLACQANAYLSAATYSFFSTSCCGPSIWQTSQKQCYNTHQRFLHKTSVDLWHLNFPGWPFYACV